MKTNGNAHGWPLELPPYTWFLASAQTGEGKAGQRGVNKTVDLIRMDGLDGNHWHLNLFYDVKKSQLETQQSDCFAVTALLLSPLDSPYS